MHTINSVLKELSGLANEIPDMIAGTLRRDWAEDTASNFLAWIVDWLLRLSCWVGNIAYPYGDDPANWASNVAARVADQALKSLCHAFGVAYPYSKKGEL